MKFKISILFSMCLVLALGAGCKTVVSPAQSPSLGPTINTTMNARQSVPSPLETGLYMGRQFEKEGRFSEAIEIFEGIVQEQGEISTALHRLAVIHGKQGQNERAKQYFARAVQVDSQNAELFTDFGFLEFENKDLVSAEQNYLAALNVDPNFQRAHNNLGVLFARTNRISLAREHFRNAGNDDEGIANNLRLAAIELPRKNPISPEFNTQTPETMPADFGEFRHLRNTYSNAKQSEQDPDMDEATTIAQIAYWKDVDEEPELLIHGEPTDQ